MAYEIEEIEVENEELEEAVEVEVEVDLFDDDEIEQKFKEMLDETHGEFMGIPASRILEECDPTQYSEELFNHEVSLRETETKYNCPVCGIQHDDEDDAKFCCQEEMVTEFEVNGDTFDTYSEAQDEVDRLEAEEEEED